MAFLRCHVAIVQRKGLQITNLTIGVRIVVATPFIAVVPVLFPKQAAVTGTMRVRISPTAPVYGPVAQMDSAVVSEATGRVFDSPQDHHGA